jgi:hypothetical protein
LRNRQPKDKTYLLYQTKKGSQKFKNLKDPIMLIHRKKYLNIKGLLQTMVQIKNKIVKSQSILENKIRKMLTTKVY